MKKLLTWVLLIALASSMAACSQAPSGTPAPSSPQSAASASATPKTGLPIANGNIELTIYVSMAAGATQVYSSYSQHPVVKKIEKETGLKLKFIHPPAGDNSFFNTTIASGQWPDIWMTNFTSYPGGVEAAMEEGVLLNMNKLIEEYAPNFLAMIKKMGVEKDFVSDSGVFTKFGTVMSADVTYNKSMYGFYIRNDLLDQYKLTMPYTYDELEQVLDVFQKNGFPTPMAIPFKDSNFQNYSNLAAGFGVTHNGWFLKDGKAVYSPIQPEYREYMQKLKSWFDKKYYSTDSLGYNLMAARNAVQDGKTAIGYGHAAHTTTVMSVGKVNTPSFRVVGMPNPHKQKGDILQHIYRNYRIGNDPPQLISATCKHPVEAMRFLDYLYTTEAQLLTAWGDSGDDKVSTFNVVNGERVFSDFMNKNPSGIDFQTAKDRYCLRPFQIKYDEVMEFQQYNYPEKLASIENFGFNATNEKRYPLSVTQTVDEGRELDRTMNQIDTYTSEMFEKFITGQASLDTFPAYVKQVEALNVQRAAQIKTTAYERYLKR